MREPLDALEMAVWGARQMRWADTESIEIAWIVTPIERRRAVRRLDAVSYPPEASFALGRGDD